MKRVRYYVERVCSTDAEGRRTWTRESLAGTRTLRGARVEMKAIQRERPSYFKGWRIVRVQTSRRVMETCE